MKTALILMMALTLPINNHHKIKTMEVKSFDLHLVKGQEVVIFTTPSNYNSNLDCKLEEDGSEVSVDGNSEQAGCMIFHTALKDEDLSLSVENNSEVNTEFNLRIEITRANK